MSEKPTAFSPSPRSTLNTSNTKARPPSAPEIVALVVLPGPSPVQVKNDPGSAFALWYYGQFQHPAGSTQKVRLFEYHQEQLQQSCFEDKCIHMFLVSDLNCTKIGCPKGLFLRLPHFRNRLAIYASRTRVAFRSPQVASMYFHIYYRNISIHLQLWAVMQLMLVSEIETAS